MANGPPPRGVLAHRGDREIHLYQPLTVPADRQDLLPQHFVHRLGQ